jgi:hypothetical protein
MAVLRHAPRCAVLCAQIDELYDAADELGLLVWQEAMLSCSPYPRCASACTAVAIAPVGGRRAAPFLNRPLAPHTPQYLACGRHGAFLADVEAEVTQQLLRLGSHASLAVLGGNNEVEQSLEWFNETRANPALYAIDYAALFLDTIGSVVQQVRGCVSGAWWEQQPAIPAHRHPPSSCLPVRRVLCCGVPCSFCPAPPGWTARRAKAACGCRSTQT